MNGIGSMLIEIVKPGTVVEYGSRSQTVRDGAAVTFGHTTYMTPRRPTT